MATYEETRTLDLEKLRGDTRQIKPIRLRMGEEGLTTITGKITAHNEPFDLTGHRVRFAYINAGGGKFFRDAQVLNASKGIASYTVGKELSSYKGIVQVAYFEITTDNGVITSDIVPIIVENSADLSVEEGSGYKNDIDKIIDEVNKLLDQYAKDLKDVVENEETRQQNETKREAAEGVREDQEAQRQANEKARQQAEKEREIAEQKREADLENAISKAQTTVETAASDAKQATKSANAAANAAHEAAQAANDISDELKEARENGDFDGATFTPHIETRNDEEILSWTNDRDLPNPDPVNIRGKQGIGLTVHGKYQTIEELQENHPTGDLGDAWIIGKDFYTWNGDEWQYISQFQGERGSLWFVGTAVSRNNGGAVVDEFDYPDKLKYDLYLNTETYDVFWFNGTEWVYSFTFEGGGGGVKATLTAEIVFTSEPSNGIEYLEGETVTAEITIQNQSVFSLFEVETSVNDEWQLSGETSIEEMRAGSVVKLTATHEVTQDDYGKQTLACTVTSGNGLVTATAVSPFVPLPARNVKLTADINTTSEPDESGFYYTWDLVEWETEITNSGNITLHNVSASFSIDGATIINNTGYTVGENKAEIGTMEPSATVTVKCSLTIPESMAGQQFVTNTVTVTSDETTAKDTSAPFNVSDTVRSLTAAVTISNQGTGEGGAFQEGDNILYNITVMNPSSNEYHNVTVTEQMDGATLNNGEGYTVEGNKATLNDTVTQNGRIVLTAYRPVSQDDYGKTDIVNTVYVESDERSFEARSAAASIVTPNESITAAKTITTEGKAEEGKYYTDDNVGFKIAVRNNGNITIKNVEVAETLSGCVVNEGSGYSVDDNKAKITTLEPNQTVNVLATYKVAEDDAGKDTIINSVNITSDTVSTTATASPFGVSDEVHTLTMTKAIANKGTGSDGTFMKGDTINYEVELKNTGRREYDNVILTDQLEGCTIVNGSGYTASLNTAVVDHVDSYQTIKVNAQYPVKESDLGNDNLVNTIKAVYSNTEITASSLAAQIEAIRKSLSASVVVANTGTGQGGAFTVGDTVQFRVTITNDGNVALSNIVVNSSL